MPVADRVPAPLVEVMVQSPLWKDSGAEAVVRDAIAEAAALILDAEAAQRPAEVAVVLTDDASIRDLNRSWRGIDRPTNVLSFEGSGPGPGDAPTLLGDIVIAYETTAGEAAVAGKPLADHVAHLAVHGFLHLLGYDHQSDDDADTMERLERSILARLAVPDPYASEIETDGHA